VYKDKPCIIRDVAQTCYQAIPVNGCRAVTRDEKGT